MTGEKTRFERYVEERIREHKERICLREMKTARKEAGIRRLPAERVRESEERARLRELRRQPCGAKTRAGHPCQRKGAGRGGRCRNHGGARTGPRTPEGRQRIAEAQRRRWSSLDSFETRDHYQNLDCLSANDLNRLLEVVIRQPVARVCVPIGHRRYSVTTRIYPLSAALHQDRRRNSNYSTSANFAVSLGTVLVPSTSTCCRL